MKAQAGGSARAHLTCDFVMHVMTAYTGIIRWHLIACPNCLHMLCWQGIHLHFYSAVDISETGCICKGGSC